MTETQNTAILYKNQNYQLSEVDLFNKKDISLWPSNINQHLNYWLKKGPKSVQNLDLNLIEKKILCSKRFGPQ